MKQNAQESRDRPPESHVEAWIDVGGTFTDCFVLMPEGLLRSCKVLSSGVVPIACSAFKSGELTRWYSAQLASDVAGFWVGAELHWYDGCGRCLGSVAVVGFADATLDLACAVSAADLQRIARWELHPQIEAPVLGVRRLLSCGLQQPLPPLVVRLGTTRGTNALLTRRGARIALAITAPFEDLLKIGDQTRPDLFKLHVVRPQPLAERTIGIHERLAADGTQLEPLDEAHAVSQLQAARRDGCTSLAICLMHSYLNPVHEQRLAVLAERVGFEHISLSSRIAPLIEIVARAQTTVVDAYLSPIVGEYLSRLRQQFSSGGEADLARRHSSTELLVMTSAGGLMDWQHYSGKDSILSGPAGGVCALRAMASAEAETEAGCKNSTDQQRQSLAPLIGLDMGGTSTDVCRVSDDQTLQYESTKAGVRILTPTLPIETVAAGGGSVCWFDGVSLRVGPDSAGAEPGPACYGCGGPATITDMNVHLGRIPKGQFPFPIATSAIVQRLDDLRQTIVPVLGEFSREELAEGFRKIANEQMAAAVRTVSIAQGADPREHALVGFGGAAGQHICEVAELLGIEHILDAPAAGLLSSLGMGLADRRFDSVVAVYSTLEHCDWSDVNARVAAASQELDAQVQRTVREQSVEVRQEILFELRYVGTDLALPVPPPPNWLSPASAEDSSTAAQRQDGRSWLRLQFDDLHRQRYGYAQADRAVELVAVRLSRQLASAHKWPVSVEPEGDRAGAVRPLGQAICDTPSIHTREELNVGESVSGPAIVLSRGSTLFVANHWTAQLRQDGTLRLNRSPVEDLAKDPETPSQLAIPDAPHPDPVFRDCVAQRLSAIATQMGLVLQQTAISVNVKQRRDYSCAVFDAQGRLLANAPHVPVHLGAMGATVQAVKRAFPTLRPGEHCVINDPYQGGSHLPDITLVTPVFQHPPTAGEGASFYVACRAHHADVGGIAPGSMSISARRLGDEGVIIPPTRLADDDPQTWNDLRTQLARAAHPPRNLDENLADLHAQAAANARGVELLSDYARQVGWARLAGTMELVLQAAEHRVRNFIKSRLADNFTADGVKWSSHTAQPLRFIDHLDDGSPIAVAIVCTPDGGMQLDFTSTGGEHPGNFNANASIVTAAIMYVLRCLIDDDMPMNDGVMRCVQVQLPRGILNPAAAVPIGDSPAVAAGNVETSQRVVDVLLGALGVAAASQGTMNNLLFGNNSFGFYETICGGSGGVSLDYAAEGTTGTGASGIHTHMTNTRLTDPEILESRYPVRLVAFGLRPGSGGVGTGCGGDGVVRELEFQEPVELSLLTSRRGSFPPFGLQGGEAGKVGVNRLIRYAGGAEDLPACCHLQLVAGDRLRIETPGGGGFGPCLGSVEHRA